MDHNSIKKIRVELLILLAVLIAAVFWLYKHGPSEVASGKPVLYLYPTQKTEVSVKLDLNGTMDSSYPEYWNGWNVTASPDGTITDSYGKEYSYLFWDAHLNTDWDFSSGFVVKGSDTVSFLQKKLAYLGLTPKEYNEFIVYWLPKLQKSPYNLIAFQAKAYTDAARLTITPKPDSELRVFMAYKPLSHPISVPEQRLTPFVRKGFCAVEWGGSEPAG